MLAGLTPATATDQKLRREPHARSPTTDAPADAAAGRRRAGANPSNQAAAADRRRHAAASRSRTAAAGRRRGRQARGDARPAPAPTTAPVVAPAPTRRSMPLNAPTGLQRLVPLYQAPETTATMIQIAAERGITHARLNLKPVELGGIEVRLQHRAAGHRRAARGRLARGGQAAPAGGRRPAPRPRGARREPALARRLDAERAAEQQNPQAEFDNEFGDAQAFGSAAAAEMVRRMTPGSRKPPAGAETTLVLPNGVLVDVLA